MSVEIVLPALIASIAGVLATASHRRLRPPVGARLLAVTMVAVAAAVVPAVLVLAFGFLTHLSWFGGALAWCREAFGIHPRIPDWLGIPALVVVATAAVRLYRVRRSWRRYRCTHSDGVQVLPSAELFAYTMPGPGGHIVVSDGLVNCLGDCELAVVVAHEQAHARHRHDRFVLLGSITVALLPLLTPLQRRLRFALERWADEETVDSLDVERSLVARTLATVALSGATTVPAGAVGIGGLGVAGRVTALLEPPPSGRSWWALGAAAAGIIAVLTAAGVQAHHVVPLLVSLCPG